jgi:DeoR/GlpR family transcriptional regulator of sugar metabolism
MHAIERAEYILSMLEKNKVVMVTDLSREMGVTEETVRKDLEKLEKQEKLNRVHGGAYLNEGFGNETPISVRSKVMQEEKKLLASLCMQWIHEKSSIFLDCSTTALHIAKQLADFPGKLTVMTNSLAVAKEIDANPQIRLILFGGELNRDREAFEGQTVLEQMKTCFINYAFVSSAGCSLEALQIPPVKKQISVVRY